MPHFTSRSWTDADIERLQTLAAAGASLSRAAAALGTRTTGVQKIAGAEVSARRHPAGESYDPTA